PALQELFVGLARLRRQLPLQLHVEQRAGAVVAGARDQELGFEACGIDARFREHAGAVRERLTDRHLQTAAASRACRRSSAASASVNSSSSPSRTLSRLCTVSFTRWSVTRFSGKL